MLVIGSSLLLSLNNSYTVPHTVTITNNDKTDLLPKHLEVYSQGSFKMYEKKLGRIYPLMLSYSLDQINSIM